MIEILCMIMFVHLVLAYALILDLNKRMNHLTKQVDKLVHYMDSYNNIPSQIKTMIKGETDYDQIHKS